MAGCTFVNACVFSRTTKRTLLPWTIQEVPEPNYTFVDFFSSVIRPKIPSSSDVMYELELSLVGHQKDALDPVDPNLPVSPVVISFGRYLKYEVSSMMNNMSEEGLVISSANAFDVLMESARQIYLQQNEPVTDGAIQLITERNRRHKLYNDIIKYFISKGLLFKGDEVNTIGNKLVHLLCDIFWHIDGHHHVFRLRSVAVPAEFQVFLNYNVPELSKHRKRRTCNLSSDALKQYVLDLSVILEESFWDRVGWCDFKQHLLTLLQSLSGYVKYLCSKNKAMKEYHKSPTPVREIANNLSIKFLSPCSIARGSCFEKSIEIELEKVSYFEYVFLTQFLPSDPSTKHRILQSLLQQGLSIPTVLLTYSPGSNIGNLHFIWKVPPTLDGIECLEQSQHCIEIVRSKIPVYHTRAMRSALFQKFGRITSKIKPAVMRYFYKSLTGDCCSSETSDEAKVDARIALIIDMEDPNTVPDLRSLNSGQISRYDSFWNEFQKFLNENTAVNDRRHGNISHLALALSVRDFIAQVKAKCSDPDILVPSEEWVRLQFWPKTPSSKVAMQYTGRLKVKFQIQQRQWRRNHVDGHYAAACFRYMREYAVMFRDHSMFICLDDKHKVKIGEPDCPVASAERGRRVLMEVSQSLQAGDHDFTKFGIIPSVAFILDIPDDIEGSWYTGSVYVGIKNTIFEPSSPFRHACELYSTITSLNLTKSILFLYTDGGPDHRLTYLSVQISLICLFLKLDLDLLCAARTAPYHSWRNPVERLMSVLNLGLQCVALARAEMPQEFEIEVAKCNSLSELRKIAERKEGFVAAVADSLSNVKILLCNIFSRLTWKDQNINIFHSASEDEISDFWSSLIAMDSTLKQGGIYRQENLKSHPNLYKFISHCCHVEHYTLSIIKCGKDDCSVCKPIRLSLDIFSQLHHLPLPIPSEDGHYLSFAEVFCKDITGEHRPSLLSKPSKSNSLPFYASIQHVKNCQLVMQCENCDMWRIIFSKYKLKGSQRQQLQLLLDNVSYTCGSKLKDLDLPDEFCNVEVRDHRCKDPIEKMYYSAKFEPICIYCGQDQPYTTEGQYPQCDRCHSLPPFSKK